MSKESSLQECKPTRFRFNLNEYIRFKPTVYGKTIYLTYWMAYSADMKHARGLVVDNEGYADMQLWEFMCIFGPHFQGGIGNQPCETTVYLIDTVTEQLRQLEKNPSESGRKE